MKSRGAFVLALLACLSMLPVRAEVVNTSTPSSQGGGGGGGGAASAITPAVTTVTGCTNRVLYGDGSGVLGCEAVLTYTATTDTLESSGQVNISGPDATTNVEIGSTGTDANAGTGGTSVVIGNNASNASNAADNVLIGSGTAVATATATRNTVVGTNSVVTGASLRSVVIGSNSNTSASFNTVVGESAVSQGTPQIVLGYLTSGGTTVNSFTAGSGSAAMSQVFFGKGQTSTTATDYTINGTGGSGADNAGASAFIAGGKGTGTGKGGQAGFQRPLRAATSSTLQSLAPAVVVCPSITLSNTSATAQTIATITTTTTSAGAVSWFYAVTGSNGTAVDVDGGTINVGWNNNAGTVAATAGTAVSTANSVGSGTFVALPTVTVATSVVSLKVTPTWTVITPTTVTGYAVFQLATSGDTVVCQ